MDSKQQAHAIQLARRGERNVAIANQIGVHARTLNRWLQRGSDPNSDAKYIEFALAFNAAKSQHEGELLGNLNNLAHDGEVKANTSCR